MQKHPLIRLGDLENVTHLSRPKAFDVAEGHNGALGRGQGSHRLLDHTERFAVKQQRLRGVLIPSTGRR